MTLQRHDDCSAMIARIEAYVDGELETLECSVLESHCEQCMSCAALVRGLRETVGLCRDLGRTPLPESVTRRAREQVKRLLSDSRISSG